MFHRALALIYRTRPHRHCSSTNSHLLLLLYTSASASSTSTSTTTSAIATTTRLRRKRTRPVVTHHHHPSPAYSHSASVSSPSPHNHHSQHHYHTYHQLQRPVSMISSLQSSAHPLSAMSTDPASTLDQAKHSGHPTTAASSAAASASTPNQQPDARKDLKDRYIGSIDQGTTSSRFIIFNGLGHQIATHQEEFTQLHPHSGWHEQYPHELIGSAERCIEGAVKKFVELGHSASEIEAVGITSQRETTIVWDWETGTPLHNAIAWPDTRTKSLVRELKQKEGADDIKNLCGLPLSTYPSSIKLLWLLQNCPEVKKVYDEGRLAFGTVDTWLLYNLNGGVNSKNKVYVTDVTNASRTMFVNLYSIKYDDTLLKFFDIDKSKIRLPEIVPSSDGEAFGKFAEGSLKGVRITSCLGDQSAALVGHCAFTPGTAKNTYGTGCFLLYNVGETPVISKHGLLATVAFQLGKERKPVYALEGSVAVAGSGVSFLMNNMGFFRDSRKVSEVAATVENSGGCVFVTAFSGLFAPYWIDDAKGTIFGITHHTQRGHIARATLEAVCFQTKAILDAMKLDSGQKLYDLAVDGGMSNSEVCMQTQADIIQIPVERPAMHETTALGAAIAAGFAIGIWNDFHELMETNRANRTVFHPQWSDAESSRMYKRWSKAVEMSRGWLDQSEIETQ